MSSFSKTLASNIGGVPLGVHCCFDESAISIDWTALRSWRVPRRGAPASSAAVTMSDTQSFSPGRRRQHATRHTSSNDL